MNNSRVFHGIYRGEVVDSDDPLRAGRVRVRVFGVFDDFSTDTIPWALYCDAFMNGQSGFGGFWVPDIGSHVFVMFEAGDPDQPVYIGGAPANGDGPQERLTNYPQNHVIKTKSGHVIEINDAGIIHIAHSSGTEMTIDGGGNVDQVVVGSVTQNVSGDVDQTIDGNLNITAGGDVTITGANINLN